MRPMAAALTGALIAGVGMYAIGARAQDQFAMNPALAGTPAMSFAATPQGFAQPGTYYTLTPVAAPVAQPVAHRPASAPVVRTAAAPRQTVYRSTQPRIVSQTVDTRPQRSKTKTALVIGGSAASGAGLGGLLGGKKGALVGAALGGGAASIYEATRR